MAASTKKVEEGATPAKFTESLKIAVYGKWGIGKTEQIRHLIARYGAENVKVLSIERGLRTVESALPQEMVVPATSLQGIREGYSEVKKWAESRPDPTKAWVVADGMTRGTNFIATEELNGADRYYEAMKRGIEPATNDLPYGRHIQKGEINTMSVYNKVGRASIALLGGFLNLPTNLYATYLEEMTGQTGFEKSIPWGPDVPGKVGLTEVMSAFDYVGRLTFDEVKGVWVGNFDSRSRLQLGKARADHAVVSMNPVIEGFTILKLIDMIEGRGSEDGEKA